MVFGLLYLIYLRATRGGMTQIARVVGSMPFEDMERYDFSEDLELLLTPEERRQMGASISIDDDMLGDQGVAEEDDF